jgi:arabinogalactan oligomer/maltooligosaccharide transport system substrate-binding protein
MKKIIASIFLASVIAGAFSGCGSTVSSSSGAENSVYDSQSSSGASHEPIKLVVWHETTPEIGELLQKEFDKLKPDIEVEVVKKEKMTESLKLAGDSGEPDMYFFAHDKIGTFAQMEIIAPVTDFISKDDLADMLPMTVEAATYQNQVYQAPIFFETTMFLYNKALMKQIPKTTEELYNYAKENTKDGVYGFLEQHSTAYYVAAWMHSFGGYIINENAEPGLNLSGTMEAVEYHKKFVEYMPIDGDYQTLSTLFLEGKAHSIIAGPWLIPNAKEKGIDIGIASMPTIDETGKPLMSYSGVQGISVMKSAESKKEAVAAALKQILKPETGIDFAKAMGSAPANSKCYNDSDVSGNEIIMNLKQNAENAKPMPNVPEMDVMWTVTENMLTSVNKNNDDIKTECEKAQKEAFEKIEAMK